MFSGQTKQNKLEKAKTLFLEAEQSDTYWQREAREDFAFRDGFQWTTEEKQILESEMRPVLTFNLTKAGTDLVMGMNDDNRIKYKANPVEPTDGFLCDVLNDVMDWIYDSGDFIDEEDAALESAAICGRGYCAVDFVPDPNRFGDIKLQQLDVPVHEIHFEPSARRKNLEDASYITWDRWMHREDFKMRYPKYSDKKIDEMMETGKGYVTAGDTPQRYHVWDSIVDGETDELNEYSRPLDLNFYDRGKNQVRVIHMEYWESFKRYFGHDPETNEWVEFDSKDLKKVKMAHLEEYGEPLIYETLMDKKVKWLQFTGDDILYDDDSPLPYRGFSITPMVAYRDASKRTANHYGLVRLIKDPQKEINKRWSQTLNMLNQQVQPGLFAETGAFVDSEQARLSLKDPGSITYVQNGALTSGKIKERELPAFPSAPMQMEQFSQDIMKKITGINTDLLGQDAGRAEAGIVVRMRQQQGLTILKPLFKASNNMKKELFKRNVSIVTEYMSDEQILRILGQGDRYQIDKETGILVDTATGRQAEIRDIKNLEYNVKAEEAPGNFTKRMLELQTFMEMMNSGMPVDPRVIVEKTDLSDTEKMKWYEYLENQESAQAEQQEAAMQAEAEKTDRELAIDEQANLIELVTSVMKTKQQEAKDDKKLATQNRQIDSANAKSQAETILSLLEIINNAEQGAKDEKTKQADTK